MSTNGSPDSRCTICLEACRSISYLDTCLHKFCFHCISEWIKSKAECPLCKQPFRAVYHSIKSETEFKRFDVQPSENGDSDTPLVQDEAEPEGPPIRRPNIKHAVMALAARRRAASEGKVEYTVTYEEMVNFRRELYRQGVRVQSVRGSARPLDTSANFYLRNPASQQRLIPWLRRELTVLGHYCPFTGWVEHTILTYITRYNMEDKIVAEKLTTFLKTYTEHFLHEFISFAKSPFSMEEYDQQAVYIISESASDDETPGPSHSATDERRLIDLSPPASMRGTRECNGIDGNSDRSESSNRARERRRSRGEERRRSPLTYSRHRRRSWSRGGDHSYSRRDRNYRGRQRSHNRERDGSRTHNAEGQSHSSGSHSEWRSTSQPTNRSGEPRRRERRRSHSRTDARPCSPPTRSSDRGNAGGKRKRKARHLGAAASSIPLTPDSRESPEDEHGAVESDSSEETVHSPSRSAWDSEPSGPSHSSTEESVSPPASTNQAPSAAGLSESRESERRTRDRLDRDSDRSIRDRSMIRGQRRRLGSEECSRRPMTLSRRSRTWSPSRDHSYHRRERNYERRRRRHSRERDNRRTNNTESQSYYSSSDSSSDAQTRSSHRRRPGGKRRRKTRHVGEAAGGTAFTNDSRESRESRSHNVDSDDEGSPSRHRRHD